jgi:hypothetical protein
VVGGLRVQEECRCALRRHCRSQHRREGQELDSELARSVCLVTYLIADVLHVVNVVIYLLTDHSIYCGYHNYNKAQMVLETYTMYD